MRAWGLIRAERTARIRFQTEIHTGDSLASTPEGRGRPGAEVAGEESVFGALCTRDRGVADFEQARSTADGPPQLPFDAEKLDLTQIGIEVWLDGAGRIRRAFRYGWQRLTRLELAGFAEPDPIALPAAHEIVPEDS